jgi:hypothetical protein
MIFEDRAYLLFARTQGETSLWLSLLSEHYGRLQLTFKGGQKKAASLPYFTQLSITWRPGKQSGGWLTQCEAMQYYPPLQGMANWSALYANELLHRSLLVEEPVLTLFKGYEQLVATLRMAGRESTQMSWALRQFEWMFLSEMGYGLPQQTQLHQPLIDNGNYQWQADGWQQCEQGISGEELLALMRQEPNGKSSRALRELLQWRLLQAMPSQALSMRQWWEQLK